MAAYGSSTSTSAPTQQEAMETEVKLDVSKGKHVATTRSLPLEAKAAHLIALVVTSVIALFVAALLADGRSVVKLKPVSDLKRITNEDLVDKGLDYRADELLGPTYGIGVHHDSSGFWWGECGAVDTLQTYVDELGLLQTIAAVPSVIATDGLKHPVHFLSCDGLKGAGITIMVLAVVACTAAAVMIIFHGLALLGLLGSPKYSKIFASLIWATLTAGFLLVIILAWVVFEHDWPCNNPFISSIKPSEHFEWTYAHIFMYLGYFSALLVFNLILIFTTTEDGVQRPAQWNVSIKQLDTSGVEVAKTKNPVLKLSVGMVVGTIVCIAASLASAGANGALDNLNIAIDESVNFCAGQKPHHAGPGDNYFKNVNCSYYDGMIQVLEQAGANVTKGYIGDMETGSWRVPIMKPYKETDLCPVNVHWHLGAEHYSKGQFDEKGKGPQDGGDVTHLDDEYGGNDRRRLGGSNERLGFRCHYYNKTDPAFDDSGYTWKHCKNMKVGETYEVHWPHSAAGACGTKWQYQTPFYDGVFCRDGIINILTPLNTYKKIGVQGQVFTIINDAAYNYHGNLMHGMIVDETHGVDMSYYTGSTTGTSRDNEICSRYSPITWQVDRKCHLISAESFDEMCKEMKLNGDPASNGGDDMYDDLYPHGARELVRNELAANNQRYKGNRRD